MTHKKPDPLKDLRRAPEHVDGPVRVATARGRKGYAILDAKGKRVSHGYTNKPAAEERAAVINDELAARLRRRMRRCLSCSEDFVSDGPGNRMCDPCRRNPDRASYVGVTATERKRLGLHNGGNAVPEGW